MTDADRIRQGLLDLLKNTKSDDHKNLILLWLRKLEAKEAKEMY